MYLYKFPNDHFNPQYELYEIDCIELELAAIEATGIKEIDANWRVFNTGDVRYGFVWEQGGFKHVCSPVELI
jgi:hypothetical protein